MIFWTWYPTELYRRKWLGAHQANARTLEVSAIAVYRDAADILRFSRFRHRNGQDAILECGCRFVLLDVLERYPPFEAAVAPLAKTACLIVRFRFLLAGDRKNAVCNFQADVLLIEPGQFGGDAHLLVRLVDVDLGPAEPIQGPGGRPERRKIEPAKHVVEHAIHFTMQRKEWIDVGRTLETELAALVVPGNEMLDGHGVFLFD